MVVVVAAIEEEGEEEAAVKNIKMSTSRFEINDSWFCKENEREKGENGRNPPTVEILLEVPNFSLTSHAR